MVRWLQRRGHGELSQIIWEWDPHLPPHSKFVLEETRTSVGKWSAIFPYHCHHHHHHLKFSKELHAIYSEQNPWYTSAQENISLLSVSTLSLRTKDWYILIWESEKTICFSFAATIWSLMNLCLCCPPTSHTPSDYVSGCDSYNYLFKALSLSSLMTFDTKGLTYCQRTSK